MIMAEDRTYSTAEICEMFGVSKSTLFRWERDGFLPSVDRDVNGQRQYSQIHLEAISGRLIKRLGKEMVQAATRENDQALQALTEAVSLRKFLAGDETGLRELAEYDRLPPDTILQLLRVAIERSRPGDPLFCDILKVALDQSCQLASLGE
jgi:DNA-binding transcriptional MerR regulator